MKQNHKAQMAPRTLKKYLKKIKRPDLNNSKIRATKVRAQEKYTEANWVHPSAK